MMDWLTEMLGPVRLRRAASAADLLLRLGAVIVAVIGLVGRFQMTRLGAVIVALIGLVAMFLNRKVKRLDAEELRTRLGQRSFGPEQRAHLETALSEFPHQKAQIEIASDHAEPERFAKELQAVLRACA